MLKHEFEAEGFSITNGQFKGAMLVVGFVPRNEQVLNWQFHIRWCQSDPRAQICSLARFDKEFAEMLV